MVCVMVAHLDLISYWSRSRVDVASLRWACAELLLSGFACWQRDF